MMFLRFQRYGFGGFWRMFLIVFLMSCSGGKEDIKLPLNDNKGLTEIKNVSQAYIFLKTKEGDTVAELHKGQLVTASHWVVHIDRRLALKELIVPLEVLLKKRHKKSIHSIPGARAFFSFVDTVENKMRLVPFEDLKIHTPFEISPGYVRKYPETYKDTAISHLFLFPGEVKIDGSTFDFPAGKEKLRKYFNDHRTKELKSLFLNADYRVSYDEYINLYGFLKEGDSLFFYLLNEQFWFNPNEIKEND